MTTGRNDLGHFIVQQYIGTIPTQHRSFAGGNKEVLLFACY